MRIITVKDMTIQFDDYSDFEGEKLLQQVKDSLILINDTLSHLYIDPAIVGVELITEDDFEVTEEEE